MTRPLLLITLFLAGVYASGIKYPWLTHLYSNRLKSMSFVPDSSSGAKYSNYFDDPTAQVNAVFNEDGDVEASRPPVNYQLAMRKYWALLNHYIPSSDNTPVKKWFGLPARLDAYAGQHDEPQYAQLGIPEYVPDEPVFPVESLQKPSNDDTV